MNKQMSVVITTAQLKYCLQGARGICSNIKVLSCTELTQMYMWFCIKLMKPLNNNVIKVNTQTYTIKLCCKFQKQERDQ